MRETLRTIWTGTYGLIGSVIVFARDTIADTVTRHVLGDSAGFAREANAYISLMSALGGFVIIVLSIISLKLKIDKQRRDLGRKDEP